MGRAALCGALALHLPAQVLARPGWAGSGVTPESWWPRAVFYRIDPGRFQDSDADGKGDLAGIAQRLDYLQSLGVDGIVLDGPADGGEGQDSRALNELIRDASERHIRVVMTIRPSMQTGDPTRLMAAVHDWLSAGVAGVWVPKALPESAAGDSSYAGLLTRIGAVLRSLPGERILLTDPVPQPPEVAAGPPRSRHRGGSAQTRGGQTATLTVAAAVPAQSTQAAALRGSLQALANLGASAGSPLVRFARDPATGSQDAAIAATVLLASRGAAMFDFGDEIGLDAYPRAAADSPEPVPVMQWTPVNVQQAPIERPQPVVTPPGGITPFGAYRAYVRPAHPAVMSQGSNPVERGPVPAPLPDPNTLPGFTSGPLPVEPMEGARVNVASEERNPESLLNAYKQLIALHHGNQALRNGAQIVLNRDAQDALVWVRRAPAGWRAGADVVVAANLGDKTVTLQLDPDLQAVGVRPGVLRALFTWSPQLLTGESTGAVMLPAHAVFIGEIHPVPGRR